MSKKADGMTEDQKRDAEQEVISKQRLEHAARYADDQVKSKKIETIVVSQEKRKTVERVEYKNGTIKQKLLAVEKLIKGAANKGTKTGWKIIAGSLPK